MLRLKCYTSDVHISILANICDQYLICPNHWEKLSVVVLN